MTHARRPAAPRTGPLSDEEFARLDDWLTALPDDRNALDVPMLDGFLTGVLLCHEVVLPTRWLPTVLGGGDDAPPLPGDLAATQEILDLIIRHYNTLAAHIAAREPFEPYVLEVERDDGDELAGDQRFAGLWPWALGFARAIGEFPLTDDDSADAAIGDLLVHILRHVPADPDDASDAAREWEIEMREVAERYPLDDLDHAIEEVVASVMDIADITRPRRPVSREGVKTGRNDPCPCGSGRKYKHCHGGSAH